MFDWARLSSKVPGGRAERLARGLLLVYVVLVASPMRYWLIRNEGPDYTFVFGLNYGAAHGLAFGRDLVWTNGPLGFLTFPQNIGHNLAHALVFQACAWALLAAIFAGLFFRAGIPLRNLVLFSLAVGLASPLFWYNFQTDSVFWAGALTLLILVRFSGGRVRYVTALAIIGVVPLIKLTSGMYAALALCGFLVDRVILLRWKAWREAALAAVVPLASVAVGLWLTLPSLDAFRRYLRGSWNVVSGHSAAVVKAGPALELAAAIATLAAIGFLLWLPAKPGIARFFILFLGPPLLLAMKHAFVRQDDPHIVNFFCFAALAVGLIALYADFAGWRKYAALAVMLPLPIICLAGKQPYQVALGDASGLRAVRAMWLAWRSATAGGTPAREKALMGSQAPGPSVEPEIRTILKDSPVAFLSLQYSAAYFDNLNLQIYPTVQRFLGYTPYLDGLDAEWVRTKGPRFLIFDGTVLDDRHPWAETPAMWAEVYRDYQTRLLTTRNLLLERRPNPRFTRFEMVGSAQIDNPGELVLPPEETASFWSLTCRMTDAGSLRKQLFRMPKMTMTVYTDDGRRQTYRSITDVLTTPVMGTWLPGSLPEFAAVLEPDPAPRFRIRKLLFGGPGASFYQSTCEARWFRPVK
jgi:hypothetical protein